MRVPTILTLLILSLSASAYWREFSDHRGGSKTFSHFKYYSFYSPEISGQIAYVTLSPSALNKFYILANLDVAGHQYTMFQTMDGKCVLKSQTNASVSVCEKAGITESKDEIRVFNSKGKIKWALTIKKSKYFNVMDTYHADFTNEKFIEELLNFDWSISWRPVDLAMQTTGQFYFEGKIVEVKDLMTYHDDTFGDWNFLTQPYFWLYFSNQAPVKRDIKFILGDIYFDNANRFMGITVFIDGVSHKYPPGEYTVKVEEIGKIGKIKLDLLKDHEFYKKTDMKTLENQSSTHNYVKKVRIETKDGRVKLLATVKSIAPYTSKMFLIKNLYKASWQDDAVVSIEYRIQEENGNVISGNSVGGMEYFHSDDHGIIESF